MQNKYKMCFKINCLVLSIFILFGCSKSINVNGEQWALKNNGQVIKGENGLPNVDIGIIKAWNITKGNKNVIIGVLDSGIDSSSNINLYTNNNEIPDNGIDDDNNGFIDDVHGWDFYNDDNSVYDKYIYDYHGTYIANNICGNRNDIIGVAPNLTVLPLKFMQGTTGDIKNAIKAIEYAHNLGVKIINCSWNISVDNKKLFEIIKKYDDMLFVCAAGNQSLNLDEYAIYPASYELDNVISVMAMDNKGKPYEYSGYGKNVSLTAPGVNVIVDLPEGDTDYVSGTSIAASFVSAAAGMLMSYNDSLTPKRIKEILISNVTKSDELSKITFSGGYLNVYKSLMSLKNN